MAIQANVQPYSHVCLQTYYTEPMQQTQPICISPKSAIFDILYNRGKEDASSPKEAAGERSDKGHFNE
jgi:hypothetical protein